MAVEVVRIAFRTGLHVGISARRVHQVVDNQECWSFLVPEISELEAGIAIEGFHKEKVRPLAVSLPITLNNWGLQAGYPGVTTSLR